LLHRLIWFYFKGYFPEKGKVIDHIDRNPLNNKITNLRVVTQKENLWNRKFKGYSYRATENKYRTSIMVNGKVYYLGNYDTEEDVQKAYLEAKEKYHNIKENR